eukprot:INCI10173.2.p1 GENE.INCI10173.2~~INCI10173.2.p1  ORF type:complete len:243 (+),score=34.16 INCI10173.2:45-731(+)
MNHFFRPLLREQETPGQSAWPVATAPDKPQQSLSQKLGIDVFAAMCTAFSVTPFILTIDKAVCDAAVQRFSMRESVTAGVKLLFTKPHLYFSQKAYAFVFGIYTITYATANFANTWANDIKGIDPSMPKFFATTAVNVPLSVLQDRFFVQWYGATRVRPVAIPTYVCWALRDSATISASFALPSILSKQFENRLGWSEGASLNAAQLLVPSLVSVLVHPPLHLLGIDM